MRFRKREHGGAGAFVFWVVLLGLFIYLAMKFAPPYIASNEYTDSMDSVARDVAAANYNDATARALLMKKAKELKLPVKESDIQITHTGGEVIIQVRYTVFIELPGMQPYRWTFTPRVSKPILT